jgi:hypothetical protein
MDQLKTTLNRVFLAELVNMCSHVDLPIVIGGNFNILRKPNALSRDISDHTPLLLNSGDTMAPKGPPLFKFELGLLLCDGFAEMVKGVRTNETRGNTPMEK